MPSQYYIKRGDKVDGPFRSGQIKNGIKSKKIKPGDLLGSSDVGPWEEVRSVIKVTADPNDTSKVSSSDVSELTPDAAVTPTPDPLANTGPLVDLGDLSSFDGSLGGELPVTNFPSQAPITTRTQSRRGNTSSKSKKQSSGKLPLIIAACSLGVVIGGVVIIGVVVAIGSRVTPENRRATLESHLQDHEWEKALTLDSECVPALLGRAKEYLTAQPPNVTDALTDIEAAQNLNATTDALRPLFALAFVIRARAAATEQRLADAIHDIDNASEHGAPQTELDDIKQSIANTFAASCETHITAGDTSQLEDAIASASQYFLAPEQLSYLQSAQIILTANSQVQSGNFDEALESYTRAHTLHPSAAALIAKGNALVRKADAITDTNPLLAAQLLVESRELNATFTLPDARKQTMLDSQCVLFHRASTDDPMLTVILSAIDALDPQRAADTLKQAMSETASLAELMTFVGLLDKTGTYDRSDWLKHDALAKTYARTRTQPPVVQSLPISIQATNLSEIHGRKVVIVSSPSKGLAFSRVPNRSQLIDRLTSRIDRAASLLEPLDGESTLASGDRGVTQFLNRLVTLVPEGLQDEMPKAIQSETVRRLAQFAYALDLITSGGPARPEMAGSGQDFGSGDGEPRLSLLEWVMRLETNESGPAPLRQQLVELEDRVSQVGQRLLNNVMQDVVKDQHLPGLAAISTILLQNIGKSALAFGDLSVRVETFNSSPFELLSSSNVTQIRLNDNTWRLRCSPLLCQQARRAIAKASYSGEIQPEDDNEAARSIDPLNELLYTHVYFFGTIGVMPYDVSQCTLYIDRIILSRPGAPNSPVSSMGYSNEGVLIEHDGEYVFPIHDVLLSDGVANGHPAGEAMVAAANELAESGAVDFAGTTWEERYIQYICTIDAKHIAKDSDRFTSAIKEQIAAGEMAKVYVVEGVNDSVKANVRLLKSAYTGMIELCNGTSDFLGHLQQYEIGTRNLMSRAGDARRNQLTRKQVTNVFANQVVFIRSPQGNALVRAIDVIKQLDEIVITSGLNRDYNKSLIQTLRTRRDDLRASKPFLPEHPKDPLKPVPIPLPARPPQSVWDQQLMIIFTRQLDPNDVIDKIFIDLGQRTTTDVRFERNPNYSPKLIAEYRAKVKEVIAENKKALALHEANIKRGKYMGNARWDAYLVEVSVWKSRCKLLQDRHASEVEAELSTIQSKIAEIGKLGRASKQGKADAGDDDGSQSEVKGGKRSYFSAGTLSVICRGGRSMQGIDTALRERAEEIARNTPAPKQTVASRAAQQGSSFPQIDVSKPYVYIIVRPGHFLDKTFNQVTVTVQNGTDDLITVNTQVHSTIFGNLFVVNMATELAAGDVAQKTSRYKADSVTQRAFETSSYVISSQWNVGSTDVIQMHDKVPAGTQVFYAVPDSQYFRFRLNEKGAHLVPLSELKRQFGRDDGVQPVPEDVKRRGR